MRPSLTFIIAALLLVCSASAQDIAPPVWQASALASDDMVSGRALYCPPGRVSLGADLSWLDGLGADEQEGWRIGFVGLYDLVQDAPLSVPFLGEIPADWYIGGLGGVLVGEDQEPDATAALITGLAIGGPTASIGIEYQYFLTRDLWRPLAEIPDESRVVFTVALRF